MTTSLHSVIPAAAHIDMTVACQFHEVAPASSLPFAPPVSSLLICSPPASISVSPLELPPELVSQTRTQAGYLAQDPLGIPRIVLHNPPHGPVPISPEAHNRGADGSGSRCPSRSRKDIFSLRSRRTKYPDERVCGGCHSPWGADGQSAKRRIFSALSLAERRS